MRSLVRSILTLFVCADMIFVALSSHPSSVFSQSGSNPESPNQTLVTEDEITNYYLYGQSSTPENLVEAKWIRDALKEGEFGASIPALDMKTFMTTGPGRFVRGRHFGLINDFFTVEVSRFTNNPDFTFGNPYSPKEIAEFMGIDTNDGKFDDSSIKQYDFADVTDDYAERVYIFNNGGFTIASTSQFVVFANGERRIDNFTIRPFDDNFDFISDPITQIPNYQLEDAVDPSTIGQTVEIPIRESASLVESIYDYNSNGYYDGDDYFQDNVLITDWHSQASSKSVISEMEFVVTNLWNNGVIRFLDEQQRPIIYGNNETGDDLDNNSFGEPDGLNVPQLKNYIQNGVVLIGGGGNDALTGDSKDDKLIGGKDDDTLSGGDGDTDIAVFSSACNEYDFIRHDESNWTISHARGSREDGTDTLKDVELVEFKDVAFSLPKEKDASIFCVGQDITFVIDITGSMGDDIDAVKSQASSIIDAIFNEKNNLVNSRIAIVGYKDPGEVFTILPFTEQANPEERKTAAINAINGIFVDGGGDWPEGVYSGLLHALNGGVGKWRETASVRRIILFGDAPPKDSELASTVNALAKDVNAEIGPIPSAQNSHSEASVTVPVEIFSVAIGPDIEAQSWFKRIAEENAGLFFTASTAADLVEALLKAVTAPPTFPSLPDLVVQNITATENSIEVVIKNQGTGSVPPEHDFWVDVYISPGTIPAKVNDVWNFMGNRGIVWGVVSPAVPLPSGGVITLSVGGPYYWPALSNFSFPLPSGTPIYAQVDAANATTTYGGVQENHEASNGAYNNILGPVFSKVAEIAEQPGNSLYLPLVVNSGTTSDVNSANTPSQSGDEELPIRP